MTFFVRLKITEISHRVPLRKMPQNIERADATPGIGWEKDAVLYEEDSHRCHVSRLGIGHTL